MLPPAIAAVAMTKGIAGAAKVAAPANNPPALATAAPATAVLATAAPTPALINVAPAPALNIVKAPAPNRPSPRTRPHNIVPSVLELFNTLF